MTNPSLPSSSPSGDDRPRDDRELLLFHLYGALDEADDAAVRARLEQEPELRDLLLTVRNEAALLATAAQVQADDLEFRAPDISVKRSLLCSWRPSSEPRSAWSAICGSQARYRARTLSCSTEA